MKTEIFQTLSTKILSTQYNAMPFNNSPDHAFSRPKLLAKKVMIRFQQIPNTYQEV